MRTGRANERKEIRACLGANSLAFFHLEVLMRLLAVIGALAVLAAVFAAVYFFGGYYNVAASQQDPDVVRWALTRVRDASINRHAQDPTPSNIDAPDMVKAGARIFSTIGCINCHGAPGVKWAKFSEGLRPDPPDLKDVVGGASPSQLFWVIKNGINMTGMPGFAAAGAKDNEIWALVAFLKKLPSVSEADYKAWTTPAPPTQQQ
jgi:mono/diheme cytochrome c family protein